MGIRELSKIYASEHGISRAKAQEIIESVFKVVEDCIISDGSLQIINHFTLEKVHKAEHMGTSPVTGEPITIHGQNTVRLRVGKGLKERLNK